MSDNFVHLHVHTDNSMLDGAARVSPLLESAVAQGMPAIAMTDHGNLFGAFDMWKKATEMGIKPIIGIEAYVAPEGRFHKKPVRWNDGGNNDVSGSGAYTHMTLISESTEGMHNLFRMSSDSFTEGFYQKGRIDLDLLSRYGKGLIGTTGCASGEVQTRIRMGDYAGALAHAAALRDILGPDNFFVEIMDHGIDIEKASIVELLRLAAELKAPLVLTNDLHYVNQLDATGHDALLCVQTGATVHDTNRAFKFDGSEYYLKSAAQMRAIFPDHPEASDNTLLIAERCSVDFDTKSNHMPTFPTPAGKTEADLFRVELAAGLAFRYPAGTTPAIDERAAYEASIIIDKGYSGYYLIVADFIRWARENGIRVGPGRGSGAGSLAAYAMRITDLDPLEHGLYFERFLNPERASMPDFDIDFSTRRRDDVKRYVTEKYGSDRVAQIATFNIIKAKQAIKDASRVLGYPYGLGEKLTKAVPPLQQGRDMSLADMYDTKHPRYKEAAPFREIADESPDNKAVVSLARELENIKRSTGVHAAGVIMSDTRLNDIVPLMMRDNDGQIITQFDFPTCEKLGLVKMDFLGLRNLDILDDALVNIKRNRGIDLVLEDLPFDDAASYELFASGETLGIFQLDSPPIRTLLQQMKPDVFEHVSAVLALYRPGPMGAKTHTNYAMRKNGQQAITPIHPELEKPLEDILAPTYGLIVYQEQVMEIGQRVAGYSLGKADALRRVMGKKDKVALDAEFGPFTAGMKERGFSDAAIKALWDVLIPFSDYAFNRSHTAAYAVIAYFTAYLKVHYPAEFVAALLTSVGDNRDKLGGYLSEARRMGVTVLPPDINESDLYFTAVGENVRFGLGSIKNVGESVVEHVVGARRDGGPFTSVDDFIARVPLPALNKRTVESLIKSGAFDRFGHSRRALVDVHEKLIDDATKAKREASRGDVGFDFGEFDDDPVASVPDKPEWPRKTKLEFEREMLGLYVSDHPLNGQEAVLQRARSHQVADLVVVEKLPDGDGAEMEYELQGASEDEIITLSGLLRNVEHRVARASGNRYAMAILEDQSGSIEISIMGQTYNNISPLLVNDSIVRVSGRIRQRDISVSLTVRDLQTINVVSDAEVSLLRVRVPAEHSTTTVIGELDEILRRYPGTAEVELEVRHVAGVQVFTLPHRVAVSGPLYGELKRVLGPNCFV